MKIYTWWINMKRKNRQRALGLQDLLIHTWWCRKAMKYINKKKKTGFTMIEILVVLAIVGAVSTAVVVGFNGSQGRARDAQRKTDLSQIRSAFEEYFNDNNCYPPADILDNCNSQDMSPYIGKIPCDPISKQPYYYEPLANQCGGYRVYTLLEKTDDPAITTVGCHPTLGCGNGSGYNYGIAEGATVYNPDGIAPIPSPSPLASAGDPTPGSGNYACDPDGICNYYGDPGAAGCPVTFDQDNQCNNQCGKLSVRCAQ